MKIAIDGPSGSGKSTIAKRVAEKLSLSYLDTGAMYRTVAAMVTEAGVDSQDEAAVVCLIAKRTTLPDYPDEVLRTQKVNDIVSNVAAISGVRKKLVDIQRRIAEEQGIVMDGRDIGTVVLPGAEVKIYLDASAEVRAERRSKQSGADYEEVLESIRHRDSIDKNRADSPLRQADDAHYIDSSAMSIDEVVNEIVSLAEQNGR